MGTSFRINGEKYVYLQKKLRHYGYVHNEYINPSPS